MPSPSALGGKGSLFGGDSPGIRPNCGICGSGRGRGIFPYCQEGSDSPPNESCIAPLRRHLAPVPTDD